MNVTDLKKDDDGVWRGRAMRSGKSVTWLRLQGQYRGGIVLLELNSPMKIHRRNDHETNNYSYVR